MQNMTVDDRTYDTDANGFLVRAEDLTEACARASALLAGITCEVLELSRDELARLFPTGYHRGAVKLAGLRVR